MLTGMGDEGSQSLTAAEGTKFAPLPERMKDVASHQHCAGPSGCGKSFFCNLFAQNFKACTGGKVIIISADGADDPGFPTADMRIAVDESLADFPLESLADAEGKPTLVVFDDIDGMSKGKQAALQTFETAVKERGRKLGIHSISVHHRGAANKSTQASLNEATSYVVFPAKISKNVAYMLHTYADLPKEVVSLIRRGNWGRWLIVGSSYMLGERKAAIIDTAVLGAIAKEEKKRMAIQATMALAKTGGDDEPAHDSASAKLSGLR